jgi:hypothetical protein
MSEGRQVVPAASLAGAQEKVARALQQFESLKREAEDWVTSQPYKLAYDFNPQTGRYTFAIVNPGCLPPLRFGVIIGEILHDLRSALDHLVWQLIIASGGKPTFANHFPIYSWLPRKRDQWITRRERWNTMLTDVDPVYRAVIKALQPYRRAHRLLYCPLDRLASLSDSDKHRVLTGTVAGFVADPNLGSLLSIDPPPQGVRFLDLAFSVPAVTPWPLLPGRTPLLSFRVEPASFKPNVRVNQRLPLTVAFGEGPFDQRPPPLPLDDILNLSDEVTMILSYFERLI